MNPAHAHCFRAGTGTPLVLLHGSHGTETELMPMAGDVAPGSPALGIRGTVPMEDGYSFFHRFPDRRVDEADIAARVPVLADYIETSCAGYRLTEPPVAMGFSNGAIMAAALLLTRPGLLAGAILLRPLSPFTGAPRCRLDRTPVQIIDGAKDHRRAAGDGLRLAQQLNRAGARVTHHVLPVGHALTAEDAELARVWLRATLGR